MNTKIVMSASALFYFIIGSLLSFLPNEIATYLTIDDNGITVLFLQIMSALFWGFGILNWMAKGTLIGGIYNRPIALGNLVHFGVGVIALIKFVSNTRIHSEIIIPLTGVYVIFTMLFAYIFRTHPARSGN